ncbi:GNAT family N-acetyltransferase [Amycolatopsis alkalitolerans]|uniref:GNAT family N-acetyltransferase n=1 Tax=Amycolatopsis alkalitolerans TaxID=2547244 RepID=UPI00190F7B52|nr:GNAT family N-acetyltransferase [Amycolatopsis alkalitolerans]
MEIRRETSADHEPVGRLHERAFADPRIPLPVSALRTAAAPLPPVSLVAEMEGQVAGHVMLSAGRLDAPRRLVDVYVLSPLGVLPEFQRRGIGTRLVAAALAAAHGVPLVFLEGFARVLRKAGLHQRGSARLPRAVAADPGAGFPGRGPARLRAVDDGNARVLGPVLGPGLRGAALAHTTG